MLRNRQAVPFTHGRGALLALMAVNNDQNLVCAYGWISTQGAIGDDEIQHAVANSAPKEIGHVHGPSLHAVITADDFEAIPVIVIAITRIGGPIVPIIAANIEHMHFDEAALVVVEFAFLIPAIFCEDAQRLVSPHGRISAHGLVVHRDSAIHAAPPDEVLENIGDVAALIPGAVISPHNLPAFLLGTYSRAEDGGATREDDHSDDEHSVSICELHSRLLEGAGPRSCFSHFNLVVARGNA